MQDLWDIGREGRFVPVVPRLELRGHDQASVDVDRCQVVHHHRDLVCGVRHCGDHGGLVKRHESEKVAAPSSLLCFPEPSAAALSCPHRGSPRAAKWESFLAPLHIPSARPSSTSPSSCRSPPRPPHPVSAIRHPARFFAARVGFRLTFAAGMGRGRGRTTTGGPADSYGRKQS